MLVRVYTLRVTMKFKLRGHGVVDPGVATALKCHAIRSRTLKTDSPLRTPDRS